MIKNQKHKRAILVWLAIYPLITVLFYLLGNAISEFPVPVRTFILTVIAVPTMVYIILPFYEKLFEKWLKN